jgi:acetate kinase
LLNKLALCSITHGGCRAKARCAALSAAAKPFMLLVFNSGSSSLKFGCFQRDLTTLAWGELDWAPGNRARARLRFGRFGAPAMESEVAVLDDVAAARCAIASMTQFCDEPVEAVGHRIVHGGVEFQDTTFIDMAVTGRIASLGRLAPLHNPPALSTIQAAQELLPHVPQVAVFDTAFYRDLPMAARIYPVPYEWHEQFGIRRFGFHGLSHQYCDLRATEMLGDPAADLRLVSCHLGGGCSATAIHGGRPIASTMGFSPLEGLVMGTRCGSVDPGMLLHLQLECGFKAEDLDRALNRESGLLGISGLSPDYAALERAADAGHERATLAVRVFNDRVRSAVAALASEMNGLDALILTDRIGTGSPAMRAAVCAGLEFMGVNMDAQKNRSCPPDANVAAEGSPVDVLVIQTREEWMVARETDRLLTQAGNSPQRD